MPVYVDITEGAHAKITNKGWELYRKVVVGGLDAYAGPQLVIAACSVIAVPFTDSNGVSQRPITFAAQHPALPSAYAQELSPKARGQGEVEIDVVYRQTFEPPNAPNGTIRTGASISNVKTNVDINGNPLSVTYTGKMVSPHGQQILALAASTAPAGFNPRTQNNIVEAPRAVSTYSQTRAEGADPSDKADMYVGSMNVAGWRVKPAAPGKSWLCTGIIGSTRDNIVWEVEYTFQKAPPGPLALPTWDISTFWVDPGTGQPPPDATIANGGKGAAQMILQLDFNDLALK